MNITEDFISQFTGNASTQANGKKIAAKNEFRELYISGDDSIIFGSCQGSAVYQCSVDFSDPAKPVPRCSCPSRQIPCKHVAGILYAKLLGKTFVTAEIPEDILSKRSKAKERVEKKQEKENDKEKEVDPKTAEKNKQKAGAAAAKKCRVQLEGIDLAEKILKTIVSSGLHSIDRKNEELYRGQIKELGNYYITGVQAAMAELLMASADAGKSAEGDFTNAIEAVNYLHALIKKARAYLESKITDLEAKEPGHVSTSREAALHSSIEEQLGRAWKLSELKDEGLYVQNAELIQAGFSVTPDEAKKEFVDEGIWLSLADGEIYLTKNLRPYKALNYVKADDSFFSVLIAGELSIYPGDKNPRVRWDSFIPRAISPEDLQKAKKAGAGDFTQVIKAVKNQIKNPLADKFPIFALKVSSMGIDAAGNYFIFDEAGVSIPLRLKNFASIVKQLSRGQAEGQTLVARFEHDMAEDMLFAAPVALITDGGVVRFTY
jgi:hypothetical protein